MKMMIIYEVATSPMNSGRLMFGNFQDIYGGRCPCISILWEEKLAVVLTDASLSPYVLLCGKNVQY